MAKTLIKSRLHSNKHKLKIKKKQIILNQNYLQIFNLLNRNYYPEMALSNIDGFSKYKQIELLVYLYL